MKNFFKKLIPIVLVTGYLLLVTVSIANAAAPSITSVYPANNVTNVPQRPTITANFDKNINPLTINNDTFKLRNKSGTEIKGEVSYSFEKKASFKPSGNLPYDNKYTVTITTGVIDLAGNHLASDYVWSFTTTKGTDLSISTLGCDRPMWEWELGVTLNDKGECVKVDMPSKEAATIEGGIELLSEEEKGATQEGPTGGGTYTFEKSDIESIVPCGGSGQNPCTICHLFVGVNNIIRFLTFDIATPLGVVVLIYAGVMILTSGGSEEKLKKGKQALWFTIWGLVIVFAGVLIVDTIIKALISGGFNFAFGPWNTIPTCPK